MAIFNIEKYKRSAKNLISNTVLVVCGEQYDIITTAIHVSSLSHQDPFTNTKGRKGKSGLLLTRNT